MSLDSALWFMIGHYNYKNKISRTVLYLISIRKILTGFFIGLHCQDTGEDSMPEQLPTTDWQDAFPHRYGHTINTQALYYHALKLAGKNKEAEKVEEGCESIMKILDCGMKNFYLPWRWKNHGKYHEKGEWFDTLGNLLAIIFDLTDNNKV